MMYKDKECRNLAETLIGYKAWNLSKLLEIMDRNAPLKYQFVVPAFVVFPADKSSNIIKLIEEMIANIGIKKWNKNRDEYFEWLLNKYENNDPALWTEIHEFEKKFGNLLKKITKKCSIFDELNNQLDIELGKYLYIRSSTNLGDNNEISMAGAFNSTPVVKDVLHEKDKASEILYYVYLGIILPKTILEFLKHKINITQLSKRLKFAIIVQKLSDFNHEVSGQILTQTHHIKSKAALIKIDGNKGLGVADGEEIKIRDSKKKTTIHRSNVYIDKNTLTIIDDNKYSPQYIGNNCEPRLDFEEQGKGWGIIGDIRINGEIETEIEEVFKKRGKTLGQIAKFIEERFKDIKHFKTNEILIEFVITRRNKIIEIVQVRPLPRKL